ncbi:hypothetical protein PRUB_a2751 [Pseudoalteromonas rubra]|uniref:Uncharacterized protein n=1 Tax=Pseudoalteromonas rubra TaxID=43658 RepID=A0A8T0CBN0_9GAMM|nr:hypothetical protein [Pseudoalteromonas rubra]KAF7788157.1 hypothetical protein PRUB_a2751 [Pseudoalteromonas rubra]
MGKTIVLCLTMMLALACSKPFDPVEYYGLELTREERSLIELSIDKLNQLIPPQKQLNLYLFDTQLQADGVAILWVNDTNLAHSPTDMMFVLSGCACVVIQPQVFLQWLDTQAAGTAQRRGSEILSYFILHELGHLDRGHAGRAASVDTDYYNRDENVQKHREQDADNFASELLKSHLGEGGSWQRRQIAMDIQLALGFLSFDLQGKRIIDNFACSALNAPCAFHDMGDTHPNLELRLLRANCNLDDAYCDLLRDYEERRHSDGVFSDAILYDGRGM